MDKLVINPRERPYSPDIADMQSMLSRALAEVLRMQSASALNPNSSINSTPVCHGLAVNSQAGTGLPYVTVTAGMLMQASAALAPAPGALDSQYRVGFNFNSVNVPLPSPGAATWYLLEAQVVENVTLSDVRDIMDATTGKFVATSVPKRKECQLATQWTAGTGTQIPVPSFGDWVALAAFYVQSSATVTSATDAIDMRPCAKARTAETRQGWSRSARVPVLRTVATPSVPASWSIHLAVDSAVTNQDTVGYGGGLDLVVEDDNSNLNAFDPTAAAVLETGASVVGSTWYYLYMCPWYDVAPDSAGRQGPAHTRGILVLSANPPDPTGLFNSVAIALPAPFNNYAVPLYQAPCVGALRSNASNDGWVPMSGGNGEYVMPLDYTNSPTYSQVAAAATIPSTIIPAHARMLRWQIDSTVQALASAGTFHHEIGADAFAAGAGWGMLVQRYLDNTLDINRYERMMVPREASARIVSTVVSGTRTFVSNTLVLIGYTT